MSYGKLNIWLRYADCSLITDCWRTDLVIKTCGGEPLVDMDPTVIEKLRAKYKDYQEVVVHDYAKERRIKLLPGGKEPVYHIEVDVPPGCYVVWTRVCYRKNEETNKVMVIVDCDGEACVNLLLDAVETCTNEVFYPLLERAVQIDQPKHDLGGAARVLMAVAEKPEEEVLEELNLRFKEVEDMAPRLQDAVRTIIDVVSDVKGA
jgi:hypothetical protein